MLLKISAKRQITIPTHILNAMDVGPGDTDQLIPGPDGYLLRSRRIDYSRLARCGTGFLSATRRLTFAHSARSPL